MTEIWYEYIPKYSVSRLIIVLHTYLAVAFLSPLNYALITLLLT